MENLLEFLSLGVSLSAITLMLSVVLVNIYIIKREGFQINVNCWFCNSWTKVLYSNRNSFECSICNQYNGFTKDGGYNRVIAAQHNTSLTKTAKLTKPATNGLCTYCNNNQRLKVHQLANFVPINERNFDIEIQHFKNQLEKSYRLCRKCDIVLKQTLNRQHAWLLGNKLKNFKNKALNVINTTATDISQLNSLTLVRCLLSALNVITICYLLNVKIDIPSVNTAKQFIPAFLNPYTLFIKDYYGLMSNSSQYLASNYMNFKQFYVETSILAILSTFGFFLQVILVLGETFFNRWKLNEMIVWILLFLTSSISLDSVYAGQIKVLQICTSAFLLYSYLQGKSVPKQQTTNCQFKKLKDIPEESNSFAEDFDDFIHSSSFCSVKPRKSTHDNSLNNTNCQYYRGSSPIQNCQFQNSFATTKTSSLLNSSSDSDTRRHINLHRSMDNLHLNNITFRPQPCSSPAFSVKRPILSPPKLKTVTQNPWTAGGFWKNDVTAYQVGMEGPSCSSSQTSGYASNQAFNSLPASREHSICSDLERTSLLSEPTYHMSNFVSKSPGLGQQLYFKTDNNTFYPVLTQNNMLFLKSSSQNVNHGLNVAPLNSNQLQSPNSPVPPLEFLSEKPISILFKNLNTSGVSDTSFLTARL